MPDFISYRDGSECHGMTLTPEQRKACDAYATSRLLANRSAVEALINPDYPMVEKVLLGRIAELITSLTEAHRDADALADTVIWMTGSADFGPGGAAFEGWQKAQASIAPALARTAERTTP